MEKTSLEFVARLRKVIRIISYIALVGIVLAVLMKLQHLQGADTVLMLSMSLLAGVTFLKAYIPADVNEDLKPDLYATVISKVLFIGSSVLLIGILFSFLHLQGAINMLMIGTATTGMAAVFSIILITKNSDNIPLLKEPLMWGIATLLFAGLLMIR